MQEHTHMYIYTNCKEKERERAENALLLINKVEEFVHASFLMLPASTRLLPLSHCLAPSFVSIHTQTHREGERLPAAVSAVLPFAIYVQMYLQT